MAAFRKSLPSMFVTEGNSSENEEFNPRTSNDTEEGADIIKSEKRYPYKFDEGGSCCL